MSLALNALLGPKPERTSVKQEPFECGVEPREQVNVKRVSIKYYATAIMFVLFDLETVLLYIWGVSAAKVGVVAFVEFAVFMAMLVLALVYVWREGVLDWEH
ncbi:NADH-quinone oxidoreductase subunit A [Deltaproteobacteria bacterium TL4]